MPEQGQSALVIPVSAVESAVSRWRSHFDPSAAQGMPAHITVVYPFLPAHRLADGVLSELRGLCGEVGDLDVSFARTARFPGLLYLDPEPAGGLRRLTVAIVERWPEAPRYGGDVDDEVVPHLTVAYADGDALDAVEADVRRKLPLAVTLTEARLYVFERGRWLPRATLPLHGSRSEG